MCSLACVQRNPHFSSAIKIRGYDEGKRPLQQEESIQGKRIVEE
jgi:hypothetical protein